MKIDYLIWLFSKVKFVFVSINDGHITDGDSDEDDDDDCDDNVVHNTDVVVDDDADADDDVYSYFVQMTQFMCKYSLNIYLF